MPKKRVWIAMAFVFSACSESIPGSGSLPLTTLEGQLEGYSAGEADFVLRQWDKEWVQIGGPGKIEASGRFSYSLPTPEDRWLKPFKEYLKNCMGSIRLSDPNARVLEVGGFTALQNGKSVGYLMFGQGLTFGFYNATFVYSDRPLTVTGSSERCFFGSSSRAEVIGQSDPPVRFSFPAYNLKTGWNRVLGKSGLGSGEYSYTGEFSTSSVLPSGVKWTVCCSDP